MSMAACDPLSVWCYRVNYGDIQYDVFAGNDNPYRLAGVTHAINLGLYPVSYGCDEPIPITVQYNLQIRASEQDAMCTGGDIDELYAKLYALIRAETNGVQSDIQYQTASLLWSMDLFNSGITARISETQQAVLNRSYDLEFNINNNIVQQSQAIQYMVALNNQILRSDLDNSITNTEQRLRNDINTVNTTVIASNTNTQSAIQQDLHKINYAIQEATTNLRDMLSGGVADIADNLGEIISNIIDPFIAFFQDMYDLMHRLVYETLPEFFDGFIKLAKFAPDMWESFTGGLREALEHYQRTQDTLLSGGFTTWDEFESVLGAKGTYIKSIADGLKVLQLIPFILKLGQLLMYPAVGNLELLAEQKAAVSQLPTEYLAEAYRRDVIDLTMFTQHLGYMGFNAPLQSVLLSLTKSLLGVDEIRHLYLRGEITEGDNDTRLKHLGYNDLDVTHLKSLYKVLPSVQDLVLMAVREVFTPEIANKYGLFQDFPEAFKEQSAKIGLSEEWSKNYWAAHWRLPSALQAYDMLHRRVINRSELEQLLKAQDYMPFWRDKLVQISYRPLTRVDVRRMHDVGVLNRQEVYNSYLDVGYAPTNAERMTEFTIRYNADIGDDGFSKLKNLTRTVIQSAYKKRIINRDDALGRLQELGYSFADSDLLLDMLDYEEDISVLPDDRKKITTKLSSLTIRAYTAKAISRIDAEDTLKDNGYTSIEAELLLDMGDLEHDLDFKATIIKEIKQLYYEQTIDAIDLRVILESNGFTNLEIENILSEINVFKLLRGRKLTRTDLKRSFKDGIITTEEYINELQGLGYPDKYVAIILMLDAGVEQVI